MKSFLGMQLPAFMPDATLGAVRAVTTEQLIGTGTKAVVVNTFHLMLSLGEERLRKLGGIKKLMGWHGLVVSDSGGFQVYSLIHRKPGMGKVTQYGAYFTSPRDGRKVSLTPEQSIDMQIAIGSDVLIALDDCRASEVSPKDAGISVATTTQWARRAKDYLVARYPERAKTVKLFAVVQGGAHPELRKRSAAELREIGFDGYCFGGWPVDGERRLVTDILETTARLLPDDKPKYAMGIGTPDDIRTCVKMGYNLFDCVLPTRNARHGLLYTSEGKLLVTNSDYAEDERPVDSVCHCETCTHYSRAYLHHLFKVHELTALTLATIHNLTHYARIVKERSK